MPRLNFELDDQDREAIAALAKVWKVSLSTVLRAAVAAFIRLPQKPPSALERFPGRRAMVRSELTTALARLRETGAQPSQIAAAKVGDVVDAHGAPVLTGAGTNGGAIFLQLKQSGRYPGLELELTPELRGAIAVIVATNRKGDLVESAPLLARENGRHWSSAMIRSAIRKGTTG